MTFSTSSENTQEAPRANRDEEGKITSVYTLREKRHAA
jgi:hypothetical protein